MQRILFAAMGLALSLGPALAAPVQLNQIYDLYLGGVKAGELTIDADIDEARYSAQSVMRTAGVVGMVYRASFEAETHGTIGNGRWQPAEFKAASRMKKKEQYVEMRFAGDAPSEVTAEPAFVPKPWQVDPTAQNGAFDPITAALAALAPAPAEKICNTTVDVFDGRRRYEVILGAPVDEGKRTRCPALYKRIAGYKPKMMKKQAEFPFDIWFETRADGQAQIVRAAGETMFGVAVVLLRD